MYSNQKFVYFSFQELNHDRCATTATDGGCPTDRGGV
jgi:hypothetical protein